MPLFSQLIALASFHYAFSGFFHFFVGTILFVLSFVMMVVNLGSILGPSAAMILQPLERIQTPNGETFFTFHGKLMVDGILFVILIFVVGKWGIAFALLLLTGAVVALKEQEAELFEEVFRPSDSSSSGGGGVGSSVPGDWSGGYQSVES